jgi:hypothetical protein
MSGQSSSTTRQPASTASRAEPVESVASAALLAGRPWFHVERTTGEAGARGVTLAEASVRGSRSAPLHPNSEVATAPKSPMQTGRRESAWGGAEVTQDSAFIPATLSTALPVRATSADFRSLRFGRRTRARRAGGTAPEGRKWPKYLTARCLRAENRHDISRNCGFWRLRSRRTVARLGRLEGPSPCGSAGCARSPHVAAREL